MRAPILVLNAGSSSLKFSTFDALDGDLTPGVHGQVSDIGAAATLEAFDAKGVLLEKQSIAGNRHDDAIEAIHRWFSGHLGGEAAFAAVGHRVVHGGAAYYEPVFVSDQLLLDLDALVPRAPLHQPHNLTAIRAVQAVAPLVPQIACFDTAFHHGQPEVATRFALPESITAKGVRRYGFHGLSYEYIVSVLPLVAGQEMGSRIVVAHLGSGASMCAIRDGRSIASTMGLTPVDGLPMATRTGTLDPGVILYLLQHEGMDARSIERLVYEQSGLLGVSGLSGDMRTLLASKAPAAKAAIDLFVYRVGRELGSLVAALGGLDGLVFTGGIGEKAAVIRERVCRDAQWAGIDLDPNANTAGGPRLSTATSKTSAWVIPTNENLMIARHTQRLLEGRRLWATQTEVINRCRTLNRRL